MESLSKFKIQFTPELPIRTSLLLPVSQVFINPEILKDENFHRINITLTNGHSKNSGLSPVGNLHNS